MTEARNEVRDASLRWIERALDEELPGEYPRANIRDHAEALLTMAEDVRMPVEELVSWIRFQRPGKQWSQVELRAHIVEYCDLRRRLGLEPPETDIGTRICTVCWSSMCLFHEGHWFCGSCGVVLDAA